ncbi:MAG: [FeFe] hydrogenase H-cluster radical SAM maturase HydE [Treponema sp.]|nr:[FeFe] hydrogenase H-cluster radical SAM maturase HydE [Treponema sp.]
MRELIDKLEVSKTLSPSEFKRLLSCEDDYLFERAQRKAQEVYGKKIYIRGLIEFTSYCKNDCYYCGLRKGNEKAQRYRLSQEQILECCKTGYALGFRTFVMQGGEDEFFSDDVLAPILRAIKEEYPDCAITLSAGERSYESYQCLFSAGADRYLLRHETANNEHYRTLHPPELSPENRKKCLADLKDIGFQTGCGIMVGSPGQTLDHIVEDLFFIQELKPHMVGVGPFLPHSDTPYKNEKPGDLRLTLNIVAILRLMIPNLLLPATTALGTLNKEQGRELGIFAGANVVMPNLSPLDVRAKYLLYDNKISTGIEAAEGVADMQKRIKKIGYEIVVSRGDYHV